MECYATHLSLWRAAIFCGTLWVLLPPPRPFSLSFLQFFTHISLSLPPFGWTFESTRRSQGMAIRPTNKGKLKLKRVKFLRKREKRGRGGGGRPTMCHKILLSQTQVQMCGVLFFVNNKSNSTSFQGGS